MQNQFDIVNMASGGFALVLEPKSVWEQFPVFAKKWVKLLNAKPVSKEMITVDECMLEVKISNGLFWITYDDFQESIQLEPKDKLHNSIVLEIRNKLTKQDI